MKSNLCYISISPKKVGASWLAWFFWVHESCTHALLFGVAQKSWSHGSSWPLRVSNVSMAAGGSLLTLVFGVLNMVVAAAWTFLLHSAGPAKLYGLGMFRINTTAQYEKNSRPLLRTRSSHFRSPYGYVICNTRAHAAGIFNRWEMGNMRDLMLWWQM